MDTLQCRFTRKAAVLAVQAAVLAFAGAARADEAEVKALVEPTSSVEVGVNVNSSGNRKFGEYDGLYKRDTAVGGFILKRGNGFDSEGGVNRLQLRGFDLGTTSRALDGQISSQGRWSIGFGYDELRHEVGSGFQTPLVGSMGGNTFFPQPSFGVINTTTVAGVQQIGTRALTAAQRAQFQPVDVYTSRTNTSFNATYLLDRAWTFRFDFKHVEQSGAKLLGVASSDARTGAGAAGTWVKEAPLVLMTPTNYRTDNFTLGADWRGAGAHAEFSYFGSIFGDGYNSVSWMNPMGTATTTLAGGFQPNVMSTMPANQLHQLNLSGGYDLAPNRKLVGNLSWGHNTQNANYLVDLMQAGGLPRNSLSGLVVNTNATLRLTDTSIRNWTFNVGFKYNERDNRTPSSVYAFFDLGNPARTAVNTPYSNSKALLEASGDWRIDKLRSVRLAWDHEAVKRWCNQTAGTGATPANAQCVMVPDSTEDRFSVAYKARLGETLRYSLGYGFNNRRANVDHSYYSPLGSSSGANVTGIVNGANYKGWVPYFEASRTQQLLKASGSWEATDALTLTATGRFGQDRYTDNTLGMHTGNTAGIDVDAQWAVSEKTSVGGYLTGQARRRTLVSGATGNGATNNATSYAALVAPTVNFIDSLHDRDWTLGLNASQKGLLGGRLELNGDLAYTAGSTRYHNAIVNYIPTGAAPTCDNASLLSCGSTPPFNNRLLTLKLTGNYQVNKVDRINLGYRFQRLVSNDYFYNAYQFGYSPSTLLPTGEQAPNYKMHAVMVSFTHNFQ